MGTILIFSIRNPNYKSPCILQTHVKTIHFVGMNKPKEAQQQGPSDSPAYVLISTTKAHLSN